MYLGGVVGVERETDVWIGWDEGVVTMKLGEKARLDITSDFAYGDQYVKLRWGMLWLANRVIGSSPA